MARIEIAKKEDLEGLSPANHTHDYSEINNTPSIPSSTSDLENDSGFITGEDIPEIPEVPTQTSQLENDSGFITEDNLPSVPTNVSELNNDANYITGNYNNSESGLTATDIQSAIDELKAMIDALNDSGDEA